MRRKIVFLSGGTGYLGRPLAEYLASVGHEVRTLSRKGSDAAITVIGNALNQQTFADAVTDCDTFVHLTGTRAIGV